MSYLRALADRSTLVARFRAFLVDKIGLDRAIAWTMVDTAWKVLKAPLSIFFLVTFLTPAEQGLWYSFINLGALTMFAELGFTYIITQFVSHEFAHLQLRHGLVRGGRPGRDRLFSLIRYSMRIYLGVLPLAVLILSLVGTVIYRSYPGTVLLAWYLFTMISASALFGALIQSIYQGLNQVSLVKRNIFIGTVINSLATWSFLAAGTGLWALAVGSLTANAVMLSLLYRETRPFWLQTLRHRVKTSHSWFNEIISLQMRYSVTWVSGYFIFYFIVPMTLHYQGAVTAGQLGMSLAIFTALSGMVGAWGQTKVPAFNILVARGKRPELNALLSRIQKQTFVINLAGNAAVFLLIIYLFPYFGWDRRILSPGHLLFIALSGIPNMIVFNWAYYLRAHKVEPFMILTVINGVLLAGTVWFLLSNYQSILLALAGYCCIQWFMLLPARLVFLRTKRLFEDPSAMPQTQAVAPERNGDGRA